VQHVEGIQAESRQTRFSGLRFHDLRGAHETALPDGGVLVHVVAARGEHDSATLLRSYAKRTRKADTSAADEIAKLTKGTLEYNGKRTTPLANGTFGKDGLMYFSRTYNAGRVAEWFKAPVLKFAFPRFVRSRLVPTHTKSSNKMGLLVRIDPAQPSPASECW
jgi:hypothetical protein